MGEKSTHRELEKKLRELETMQLGRTNMTHVFEEFANNSVEGLGITDLEGNIRYANKALAEKLDLDPQTLVGKNIRDYCLEEDMPAFEKKALAAVQTNMPQLTKMPLVSAQGKKTDGGQSIFLIPEEAESSRTIADITEGKLSRGNERSTGMKEEHQEPEETLRENEEFLGAVFEAIQDGISVSDTDLNVIRTNRWMEQAYSQRMPLVGRKCYQVYQQRESPCPWCPVLRAKETGKKHTEVVPYPSPDVPSGWIELTAFPIKDEQGHMTGFVEHVKDITANKKAESELRASEEKFRVLTEQSPNMIFINKKGRVVYANRTCEEITGYTRDEFYASSFDFMALIAQESKELVMDKFRQHMAGEDVEPYEYTIISKSGKRIDAINSPKLIDYEGEQAILGIVTDITGQKQTERALHDSEEKYRHLFQHAPSGIYEIDLRTLRFLSVNDVMSAYTGYSEDEFMQMNPLDLFTEQGLEVFRKRQELLKQGKPVPGAQEYEIKRKDGAIRWALLNLNYEMENGEPVRATAVAHDVTERKEMETALREGEKRYRELADMLPQVVFEADVEGNLSYANRNAFGLFGYTMEDFEKGLNAFEMVAPEDRNMARKNMMQVLKGEVLGGVEYTAQRKDGSTFPIAIYSTPITYAGEPKGLRGIIIDQTERKQAEETLQTSEAKFRDLFNFSPQAIAVTELEAGRFVDVNNVFCSLTGFTREELIGRTVTELALYSQDDRNRFLEGLRASHEVFGLEMDFVVKDGSTLHAQMFARLIDIAGKPHILTIFHDLTERKRLETQLQQAQKMEAIGTLAGGVAHDFNNLLMGIQGHASLVAMDIDEDHPHWDHVTGIEEMVRRGADLTKQLLGFARRGKYEMKPTDLNDLIEASAQWFGRTKKEIAIHRKHQQGIWPVEVDQGQVEQVLLNLYVNAWQAMADGGELHLETKNVTLDESFVDPFGVAPGNYVKVTVTDTGEGMDSETLERVFDPFFTTKEVGKGTGLGLASAYGIIRNHGGIIDVRSEKGEGTTFSIFLPASEKEIVAEKKVSEETLKGEETILLVDDEEMIIRVGETVLKMLGYTTLVAKNGEEALEVFREHRNEIDMVILDVIMPVMSGGETYDRLKEIDPAIRVLLSSGYSIDGQARDILDRGCDGFIQKPFNMKALSQKIREVLDKT